MSLLQCVRMFNENNVNPTLHAFQRKSQGEEQSPGPESSDVFGCSIGSTQESARKQSQCAAMKISGFGCEESVSAESAPSKSPALRVGAQIPVAVYCWRKENVVEQCGFAVCYDWKSARYSVKYEAKNK